MFDRRNRIIVNCIIIIVFMGSFLVGNSLTRYRSSIKTYEKQITTKARRLMNRLAISLLKVQPIHKKILLKQNY